MGRPTKEEVAAREAAKDAEQDALIDAAVYGTDGADESIEANPDMVENPTFTDDNAGAEAEDRAEAADDTIEEPAAPGTWDAYEAKLRDDLLGFLVGRQIESAVKFARDAWNAAKGN